MGFWIVSDQRTGPDSWMVLFHPDAFPSRESAEQEGRKLSQGYPWMVVEAPSWQEALVRASGPRRSN